MNIIILCYHSMIYIILIMSCYVTYYIYIYTYMYIFVYVYTYVYIYIYI